jgi:quercetin dioxygenase-like cupin family protein
MRTASRDDPVKQEVLHRRGTTLVRRSRLAPGEATPWHRDPFHRVSVVTEGGTLEIEFEDGGGPLRVEAESGQVDWDEPEARTHRARNVGASDFEEVVVFFLDGPDADPQPGG